MRKRAETTDTIVYNGRAIVHFHEKLHRYSVSVPALEKFRISQPGATTILQIKDKSGPLCGWSVNQCEVFVQKIIADNPKSWMPNEAILEMASKMKSHYRNVKQEAADIGIVVHDFLHSHLRYIQDGGTRPNRPVITEVFSQKQVDQANNAIDAGLEFFESHKLQPWTMERPVWSPSLGVIGTDDFIGLVDSEPCCIDYKTSKSLWPEIWMQTAIYTAAYKEEYPDSGLTGIRWGVNTGKDGKLTAIKRGQETYENDLSSFLAARQLWHWDRVENGGKPVEVIGSLDSVHIPDEEEW